MAISLDRPHVENPADKTKPLPLPAGLKARRVESGFYLDSESKDIAKELKNIKGEIQGFFDSDAVIILPGTGKVQVTDRFEPQVDDEEKLREVLGTRFDDFVEARVSYKAKDNLREIMCDEEHALHSVVMECASFKHSCSVSFKPEKKK